jgi:hypothetical protein
MNGKVIYKFDLTKPEVLIQNEWVFRAMQMQDGRPCFWAEVDLENESKWYAVSVVGTGHALPKYDYYVGTIQEGPFVWHFYLTQIKEKK